MTAIKISDEDKSILKSLNDDLFNIRRADHKVLLILKDIVKQIVIEDELDNYDCDGTCPTCCEPEHEDND